MKLFSNKSSTFFSLNIDSREEKKNTSLQGKPWRFGKVLDKSTLVWGFLLAFLSFAYFKLGVSSFFFKLTGSSGWSYVIDQGLPILLGLIIFYYYVGKKNILLNITKRLRPNLLPILILIGVVLLVHGQLINTFFYAEDAAYDIGPVLQNRPIPIFMFGYPLLPTTLSVLFFNINVVPYNIFTLLLLSLLTISAYWFIYILSKNKFIAFFSCLFFATTPAYINLFPWTSDAQGFPFVLFLSLISLIFLVYFQKTEKKTYYILSLIFFMAAINDGFVRSAGMTSIPIFLLWFFSWGKLKSKLYRFFLSLPYLLISFSFFMINFAGSQSGLVNNNGLISYVGKYLTGISFFVTHLFFPASFAKSVFPRINEFFDSFGSISIVASIGFSFIIFLLAIAMISVFRRKSLLSWLILLSVIMIFSNIFYVPIFQSVPMDISKLDSAFARLSPPYGPGSRYLVPSSLGVGILLAAFLWWIGKKGKFLNIFSKTLLIVVVLTNGILSFQLHENFINREMRTTGMLVKNIFSMAPHDGKPKLIFSSNSSIYKNSIDVNYSGSKWISWFYKSDEIVYTKNIDKFKTLISSGKYKKENVYAFYTNPETNAFADVSSYYRNKFFDPASIGNKKTNIEFIGNNQDAEFIPIDDTGVYSFNYPVLISKEIDKRIISETNFNLNFQVLPVEANFPFVHALILKRNEVAPDALLQLAFPNLLSIIENETDTLENILSSLSGTDNLSKDNKLRIIDIVNNRKNLRDGLSTIVSATGQEDINKLALSDGIFIKGNTPSSYEGEFFFSKTTPTEITFQLPYPIKLERILLNIPKGLSANNALLEAKVFSSLNGSTYEEVGSLANVIDNDWSPNYGKMTVIPLKQLLADSLQIVINKTDSGFVAFDEITIDDVNALEYTPEQIYNYFTQAFWYVDDSDVFNQAMTIKEYNNLNLVYACAEEDDWKKQSENMNKIVPEVWKTETLFFDNFAKQTILSAPINCYGSVLRKIIIIGPPFPSKMEIKSGNIDQEMLY